EIALCAEGARAITVSGGRIGSKGDRATVLRDGPVVFASDQKDVTASAESRSAVRTNAQCIIEVGKRALVVALELEHCAAIDHCISLRGLQLQGLVEIGKGGIQIAARVVRQPPKRVGVREFRIEPDRFAEARKRLVDL